MFGICVCVYSSNPKRVGLNYAYKSRSARCGLHLSIIYTRHIYFNALKSDNCF